MTAPAVKTQTATENIFYAEIRGLLQKSRGAAYQAVNTVMVNTYWQIGKRIVEQEQHGESRANYGDYLITNLSRYLSDTLGKGFSEANLWNMRQFYLVFPEFSTQRVENLTWTHIRLIMRINNQTERAYYIFFNYLLMNEKSDVIKTMASGGTATPNLNKGAFEKIEVIIPPAAVLQTFNVAVEPLFAEIGVLTCENQTLAATRDKLKETQRALSIL